MDTFYGYFNIIIGAVSIVIGFKIYKPFSKEREEMMYTKYKNLYRFGGIGLLIWGLIKVL